MDSLSNLLSKEGFTRNDPNSSSNSNKKKQVKFNKTVTDHDSVVLPIYICHNRRKSFELPNHKRSSSSSKGRRSDEPAIDEVATKAVISILSGCAGKYLKHKECRDSLRDTCCLFSDNVVFGNMELGIESVEKLIENHPGTIKDMKMKLLRNSIGFLTIVASSSNSQLSACAHLYLSIVYKIDKNDRICATHVLQVFVDSPQLARTHLLPDLWEHFFLPHLLHLKIWYNKQTESLLKDQEQQAEHLKEVYEDHLNTGTVQFAIYYKEWLKTGGQPPANLPSVPLPLVNLLPSSSTRRRSCSSFNNFLHRAIFGNDVEKQPSMEFDYEDITHKEEQEEELCLDDYNTNQQINIESRLADRPSQSFKRQTNVTNLHVNSSSSSSDLTQAISTISSSQSLTECEMAIRVMAKAWLDDPLIEKTLSRPLIIQGMLEVLFSSNNEEVLELAISLLTEFVTRNESNCKIITNFDPQLEGFMNLMRNSSLFLKAASLLHLVKPEGKQMVSTEWIPLVLRVLEFGDQTQTLFSVRCSPQVAAYYFIDQLLNGFDQDRNMENGRQVISLGGLSLLLRRMASGDILEKMKGVSVIYRCVLSDGRCRHYLANNLNPELVLEVMVHAKELDCIETTIYLLIELICLHRFEQRTKLFDNLLRGWDCLNTMQILLVCLQRATRETRPLVAAIMFQLDLMGDPLESSAYREEAIEAIIESLDREIFNENVQQQAAKSLLILGSRYSYTGTPEAEKWILKEAGYDMSLEAVGLHGRYYVVQGSKTSNNEDEIEHWQRKAAVSLWMSGGKKLIRALSESIANGLACLARASLVTVAWISKFVHTVGDGDVVNSIEFSTLIQHLIQCLNSDNTIEERVLASFSLLSLSKSSGFRLEISDDEKKLMVMHLRSMSKVTWTAKRLGLIITASTSSIYSGL
ncbi:putative E3 ubiquitin-protein ligase LIN-2 [Bidens hawaiensis]|uniref:putative E3 ubiquitin-protein ligase LIN-2 n=1 Tax=Bidens hawaiensis TaxID=980011 RepID=UPI00404A69B3